jgi:hypothetical protein
MELPTMAIDGTPEHPEPSELSNFHATRASLGFRYFMPKNEHEFELLYKAYKAEKFASHVTTENLWINILINISDELSNRLLCGDMFFIDKYLGYLDIFVSLASTHPDRDFIGDLLFTPDAGGISHKFFEAASGAYNLSQRKIISEEQALYITTLTTRRFQVFSFLPARSTLFTSYHTDRKL